MSFKEVNRLRKNGLLQDAFIMAEADLNAEPTNIWNKRAIGWVYYEFLKKAQQQNNYEAFLIQVGKISTLDLPETEAMLFDSVAWSVGKLLFAMRNTRSILLSDIYSLLQDISFSKPNDSYSFMLKAFIKHGEEWDGIQEFIYWWGLDNFMPEDYLKFTLEDGTRIISLVERVYIRVSKKILKEENVNIEKIENFLPKISGICTSHPKMQYPHYYHAKLLNALGDKNRFLDAFLPFAKNKQGDFWMWEMLSEVFDKNTDEYLSCLCQALLCGAPDKFTINVREKIADVFKDREMLAEAKYEIEKIISARQEQGWNVPEELLNWQDRSWWESAENIKTNINIYTKYSELAQSLLFANIEKEIAVISYVNNEKKVFEFTVSKHKQGFGSYKQFEIAPEAGDIYAIRFEKKTDKKSNYFQILSIEKTKEKPQTIVFRKFSEGILSLQKGNSFGFVSKSSGLTESIFVPPNIINKYNLKDKDVLEGDILISFNKKQNKWGWIIIKLSKQL